MIRRENINQVWAGLMVEECVRCGLDTFFLAPGSRCTPLTIAVANHPDVHVVQHFDERGLGFAALGYARASGRPGVVITTSGTAVSNLLPSVVEAHQDAVPMLLLTGDRPPELRDCGANQSIDQRGHFGEQVEWFVDFPCPSVNMDPAYVLTTVDQAVLKARKGPVHVNCMFREPLAPVADSTAGNTYLEQVAAWERSGLPYTSGKVSARQMDEMDEGELTELFGREKRVLVLAGGGLSESEALSVVQMAEQMRWPVVADLTSGLLFGPHRDGLIRHEDAITAGKDFPVHLEPKVVLQFGNRLLSKSLVGALAKTKLVSWVHVTSREGRFDPEHRVRHRFVVDVDRFCMKVERLGLSPISETWLQRWQEEDQRIAAIYSDHLDDARSLSEPGVARRITQAIPNLWGLVAAASMPVRDLNCFAARNQHVVHVAANRGASGIDGTIATTVGFARGLGQGAVLLIGDLATLHDLNSLALVHNEKLPIVVVVINNRGGGIFHFLPVADFGESFEKYFATPHAYQFHHAAQQFHLDYVAPESMAEFDSALQTAIRERRSTIIEVSTDRNANVALHQALQAALQLPASS